MDGENGSGVLDPAAETDSGKDATPSKLEQEFYAVSKKWRKQINYLQSQIISQRNITVLERESHALEECMKELTYVQEALENIQSSTVEKMILYGKFEDMSREANQILQQVGQTVRELRVKEDEERHSVCSSRSHRSRNSHKTKGSKLSHSSVASTSSSARLRRLDLEEEIATLRVKMNLADEREQLDKANRLALNEVERRKLEIEKEEQRLMKEIEVSKEKFKLKEQLAEKEARVEACARFENDGMPVILDDGDQSKATQEHIEKFLRSQAELSEPPENDKPTSQVTPKIPETHQDNPTAPPNSLKPQLDPSIPAYVPNTTTVPASLQAQLDHVTAANIQDDPPSVPNGTAKPDLVQVQLSTIAKLLEIQDQNRLPLPEPGVFSGDPLKYTMWVKAFETLIESRAIKPRERLHFLGKYVSGEAKEVVNGFMLLDGEDAYQKAKEMLAKRFGDPFTIATAFRRKLDEWKQIVPNDAIGLRKYTDFLVQCATAMKKVSGLNVLNDIQENHKMVAKLPKWLSTRWARVVYKTKEEKKGFPIFSEFVEFLVTESNIACDPVNVKFNRNNDENKRLKDTRKPDPSHLKYTPRPSPGGIRSFATKSENNNPKKPATNPCQLCKANHHLDAWKGSVKWLLRKERSLHETRDFALVAWSKATCQSNVRNGENVIPAESFTPPHYMVISRRTQTTKILVIHPVKKLPILQQSTAPRHAL